MFYYNNSWLECPALPVKQNLKEKKTLDFFLNSASSREPMDSLKKC